MPFAAAGIVGNGTQDFPVLGAVAFVLLEQKNNWTFPPYHSIVIPLIRTLKK
jgi:hypothetical protein